MLVLFVVVLPGFVPQLRATPTDPVVWLKAEGNAVDATTNGNNGVVSGSVPYVTGKVGNAFSFTGNGANSVRIPNSASLQSSLLTVEYWIYFNSVQNSVNVTKRSSSGAGDAWQVGISYSAGTFNLQFVGYTASGLFDWYSPALSSPVGVWTHVAATYDGSTIKGYINGTQVLSQAVALQLSTRNADIYVGAYPTGVFPLDGKVDELSIYNRALSASEVLAIFQAGATGKTGPAPTVTSISPSTGTTLGGTSVTITGANFTGATGVTIGGTAATNVSVVSATSITATTPAGTAGTASVIVTTPGGSNTANSLYTYLAPTPSDPVAWLKADGNALDSTSYGNNGVVSGSVPYVTGKVGDAFSFAGNVANYVRIPNSGSLQSSLLSVEYWVNFNSAHNAATVAKRNGSSDAWQVGIVYTGGNFLLQFLGNTSGGLSDWYSAPLSSPVGVWTHVAATYDGSTVRGYINGSQVLTQTVTLQLSTRTADVYVGNYAGTSLPLDAKVDELTIFNRALSGSEIQAIYQAGSVGKTVSAPTVTSITPASGMTFGGSTVTISGANFVGATGVTIGGAAATNVTVVNSTTITATTPAGSVGTASVIVTTPGGSNAPNSLYTYQSPVNAPTITSVSPATGSTLGGTSVTITGTKFTGATSVTFDGTPATSVPSLSDTSITAVTPARVAGAVSVIVTTPNGSNPANSLYTYVAPPTVTGISPSSGTTLGGTSVTITGTNFTGATGVTIGGAAATNVTVVNSTTITATTAARSAGTASVVVTTPGGGNSANTLYTYVTPAPVVTGVSPSSGTTAGGTSITITGSNLTGATGVTVGGVPATGLQVFTDSYITAVTPAGTAGTASVIVTTPGGTNAANSLYTYVSPPTGPVAWLSAEGVATDITGNGNHGVVNGTVPYVAGKVGRAFSFTGNGTNSVRIPNSTSLQSANFTVEYWIYFNNAQNSVNVSKRSPSGAGDAWQVGIAYAGGNFLLQFVGYTSGGTLQDWYSAPLSSPVGTWTHVAVTFNGNTARGYVNGAMVLEQVPISLQLQLRNADIYVGASPTGTSPLDGKIDELSLYNRALSPTEIQAIYDAGTAGKTPPAPTVAAVTPAIGSTLGGTSVTITGANFTGATNVTFGGVSATNVTVVNGGTITATAPAGTAGTASVVVTTPSGSNAANSLYTYVAPPTVTSITPSSGTTLGGTSVTITGTNFTGATGVTLGGTAATNVTVVNATTITATTPARGAGAASVVVTTPGGSNTANSLFTFVAPPPTVTGVSPNKGPTLGGTSVTITGANFTGATSVTFGGNAAANVTIINATTLTATTPAAVAAGAVSVVVTTPGGSNAANSLFTYEVPGVTVNTSSANLISSGSVLIITGTGFDDTTPGNNLVTFSPSGTGTVTASTSTSLTVTGITGLSLGALNAVVTVNSVSSGGPVQVANVVTPVPGDLIPLNLTISGFYLTTIAVQPDGKTIIAGYFNAVNGVARRNLARLNVNGSLDTSFDPSPNGIINAVAVQPDGKIVIGGSFNELQPNGVSSPTSRSGLARLNADGTVDTSFNTYVFGSVDAVSVQADGKVLFGGGFTSLVVDGTNTPRGRVARLNADGSFDAAFNPNVKDGSVSAILPQADGKILLGGSFSNLQPNGAASATSRVGIARVNADGSLDTGFDPRINDFGYVTSIVEQPDGKILFGGQFGSVQPNGAAGATTRSRIARVNADGTLDTAFAPAVQGVVYSLALQTNGKILVGGDFSGIQESGTGPIAARASIARLNANGSLDADFDPKADNWVPAVAVQADGTILLGGGFSTLQPNGSASATPVARFARLINDPATQTLSAVSATQVSLSRAGGGPEFSRVIFEASIDGGSNWVLLGAGTRVGTNSNWQLTGLSLPSSGQLRARGFSGASLLATTTAFSGLGAQPPAVSGISPTNGTTFGGTSVTISGNGFTGASSVTFGGTAATNFSVIDANTITAVTPVHAAGPVSVVITTAGGSNAANSIFTYLTPPAPTVTGVSPSSGVNLGGTSVTITGAEFLGATSVTFGGTAATNVTVVNSTTITATTPAQANGAVSVVVTTPSGSNSANTLYTFVPPAPTLTSVSPNRGVDAGGTLVTLTGTNFTGATSVRFGTREASSFTVVNSTTITAVTPSENDTVSVVVTTPYGSNATNSLYTFYPRTPTRTQLSSSQFTNAFLSPPTFITSVSTLGGAPVPGKIALFIDDVLLERKAVDSAGWAYFTPTPAQLRGGTRIIRAVYNDDLSAPDYFSSEASAISQTVNKSPLSISLNSGTLTQTYDGTSRPVTFTTGTLPPSHTQSGVLVNVTYNGSALVPTDAGTYSVVATINDPSLSGTASGTLTVNRASGAYTFQNLIFAWDGQPKPAVVTVTPNVPVTVTYDRLVNNVPSGAPTTTAPTNPGNYKVTVTNPNYSLTPSTTNPLTITARGVSISIGNLNVVPDGTPKPVTITTVPAGINVSVTYQRPNDNPYPNPDQPPAGTSRDVYIEATVNQVGYEGKATAFQLFRPRGAVTLSLTGPDTGQSGPQTYQVTMTGRVDGRSRSGMLTLLDGTNVIGSILMADSYEGRANVTSTSLEPGAHSITARYEGNDSYLPATSSPVTTTIAKLPLVLAATSPLTVTYDGQGKSVSFKGPGTPPVPVEFDVTYDNSTTLPVNATTTPVQVRAIIKSTDPRYTGTTTLPLTIAKAPATLALGSLTQSFDGTPKSASVITSPAGIATSVTYGGSSSPPTAAGTYSVVASVVDPNYTAQPATGTFTIASSSVRIEITNTLQTFTPTRSSYPVTVRTFPPVAYRVTYNGRNYESDGPGQGPFGAGTYDVVVTITQPGYTGTASATLVVKPLVTVNHPEITLYGSKINTPSSDRRGGASAVDGDFVSPSTPFPLVEGAKLRFYDSAENQIRYRFVRWTDGNPNRERLIEANTRVYTPIVRPEIKILSEVYTQINGVEQKSSVGGTVVPLTNGRTYVNEREVVTFAAYPKPGYIVDRWEHNDFSPNPQFKIYSIQNLSHLYGTELQEFDRGFVPVKTYFTRGYTVTTGVNVREAGSVRVVRQDGYGYDSNANRIGRVDPAFSNAAVPEGMNTVAEATPQPGYLFNTWIVDGADLAGKSFYSPDERIYELTKSKQVFKLAPFATSMKLTAIFVREVPGPVASFTRINSLGFSLGFVDLSVTRYPILQIRNAGTGPMTNAKIVGVEISGARMKPSSNDAEEVNTGGFFEFYRSPNFNPLTPEEIANPDPYFIQNTEFATTMIASKPRLTKPRDAITASNPINIGTLRPGDYQEFNNFEYFWPKADLSLGLPIGGVSFSLLQYRVTIWITADELPPTPVSFWTN